MPATVTYESESFSGEWPAGVYWSPGERRELAAARVTSEPPAGLHEVTPAAPAKAKPVAGKAG